MVPLPIPSRCSCTELWNEELNYLVWCPDGYPRTYYTWIAAVVVVAQRNENEREFWRLGRVGFFLQLIVSLAKAEVVGDGFDAGRG